MPKQQNIETVHRILTEIFLKGDLTNYAHYIDKDVVVHCPPSWKQIHTQEVRGLANTKEIDTQYAQAFKMSKVDILDCIATEEKVVVRWSAEGTHVADFYHYKATQKSFIITGVSIYNFSQNGKINEVWQFWDMFGLLQQIG